MIHNIDDSLNSSPPILPSLSVAWRILKTKGAQMRDTTSRRGDRRDSSMSRRLSKIQDVKIKNYISSQEKLLDHMTDLLKNLRKRLTGPTYQGIILSDKQSLGKVTQTRNSTRDRKTNTKGENSRPSQSRRRGVPKHFKRIRTDSYGENTLQSTSEDGELRSSSKIYSHEGKKSKLTLGPDNSSQDVSMAETERKYKNIHSVFKPKTNPNTSKQIPGPRIRRRRENPTLTTKNTNLGNFPMKRDYEGKPRKSDFSLTQPKSENISESSDDSDTSETL